MTHDRSYIFQNADGRVCFVISYEHDFTLIGTTDEDFHGDPSDVASSGDEERYLCGAVSEYLRAPVAPSDIVRRYAGVRPLLDDGAGKAQEATRDYVLTMEEPPLLSVFGGKITTYRRLAEAAMAKLQRWFPGMQGAWTAGVALPGGDFPWNGIEQVRADLSRRYPFLPDATLRRLISAYGTMTADVLGDDARRWRWGAFLALIFPNAKSTGWCEPNGRGPPRTFCGGGASLDCT